MISRALQTLWPVHARRQKIKRNVLQARLQQALQRPGTTTSKPRKRVKRDKFGSTCVFRVRSRCITNVIGAKNDLALVMYPQKHTVRNLMCDIYRAVRVPFVATLNGRKLAISDKKLYRVGAFAGGVFVINVTEVQTNGGGNKPG